MSESDPTRISVPRMSEDELRRFVDDFVSDRIWSMHHAQSERDALTSFLMLRLCGLPCAPEDVGTIYEYMSARGPMAINGMPTFLSHRIMHKDDWERVRPVILAEAARRQNLNLGEEP